ncbi:hypothetical protein K1719_028364 [Acacia pycnantha]|nr:hypothetical protein K1719_028364 [Acacia pycnantha]
MVFTYSFTINDISAYIIAAITLHAILTIYCHRYPFPLGPIPVVLNLGMAFIFVLIFLGMLLFADAEIRNTWWLWWRTKTTPLDWALYFPLGIRPLDWSSFGPTLSTSLASLTCSEHSLPFSVTRSCPFSGYSTIPSCFITRRCI